MILTATECTLLSNISASAVTISNSGLIPIVQEKIVMITNNYFLTDLDITDTFSFNTSARTIIAGGNSFEDKNFSAGDDIFIYRSYRNDGYFTVDSVSKLTLTLTLGSVVTPELSSKTIFISVVKWPASVKYVAAQMVAYDYDVRPSISSNIQSRSLGPLSESFVGTMDEEYGYPKKLLDQLSIFRMARVF